MKFAKEIKAKLVEILKNEANSRYNTGIYGVKSIEVLDEDSIRSRRATIKISYINNNYPESEITDMMTVESFDGLMYVSSPVSLKAMREIAELLDSMV